MRNDTQIHLNRYLNIDWLQLYLFIHWIYYYYYIVVAFYIVFIVFDIQSKVRRLDPPRVLSNIGGKDCHVDAVAESRRVGDGGHLGHQGLVSTCNVTRAPTSTSALPVPTYPVASGRYRSRLSPCLPLAQRKPAQCTTGATDSDKVGVCLHINDNGMNINSLSALPSGSFTLEIQVKPISTAASCCLTTVQRRSRSWTERADWSSTKRSQLNLHWDNEMSVLHVYVVVSYTNTLVHVVGLSSDALTPGGTLIPGEMAPQAKRLTSTGIPFNGRDACVEATAQPHGCVAELLSLTNSATSVQLL